MQQPRKTISCRLFPNTHGVHKAILAWRTPQEDHQNSQWNKIEDLIMMSKARERPSSQNSQSNYGKAQVSGNRMTSETGTKSCGHAIKSRRTGKKRNHIHLELRASRNSGPLCHHCMIPTCFPGLMMEAQTSNAKWQSRAHSAGIPSCSYCPTHMTRSRRPSRWPPLSIIFWRPLFLSANTIIHLGASITVAIPARHSLTITQVSSNCYWWPIA